MAVAAALAAKCSSQHPGAAWAVGLGVVFGLAAIGSMIASAFYDGSKQQTLLWVGLGVLVASLIAIVWGSVVLVRCGRETTEQTFGAARGMLEGWRDEGRGAAATARAAALAEAQRRGAMAGTSLSETARQRF